MKRQSRLHRFWARFGTFSTQLQPLGILQLNTTQRPPQKTVYDHFYIGEREHCSLLRSVLLQSTIAKLGLIELALDKSAWMLHFGPQTDLKFLGLLSERTPRRVLFRLTPARTKCHMPIHASYCNSIAGAQVVRISDDNLLLAMPQCVPAVVIVHVGCCANDSLCQTGISIEHHMRFDSEEPLITLLEPVHLSLAFSGFTLYRAGCPDKLSFYQGFALKCQAVSGPTGVDDLKVLNAQVVIFELVPNSLFDVPVGEALGAADAYEITVGTDPEQYICGTQFRQPTPKLQAVTAQHYCRNIRRAVHIGQWCLRRMPKSRTSFLFHVRSGCDLGASVTGIDEEF